MTRRWRGVAALGAPATSGRPETSWLLRAAAWLKYLLTGAIDRSRRVAAHTELTTGGRTLRSEVVAAELDQHRLRFALQPRAAAAPGPSP